MQAAMIAKLRDWYIVVIAVCAILAGLYLASGPSTPSGSATQATVAPSAQAPQSKIASQNPAPLAGQTPNAPSVELVRPPVPAASAAPSQTAATIRSGDNTGDGRHALGCTHQQSLRPTITSWRLPRLRHKPQPRHLQGPRIRQQSTAMRQQVVRSTENARPAIRWSPARTRSAQVSRASSAKSRLKRRITIIQPP